MPKISYIREEDLSKYEGLSTVESLSNAEDVATLLETFNDVKRKIGFENIKSVVEDNEKYYYFVVSGTITDFDIFEFINKKVSINVKVSCLNAKLMFPESLSRGVYISDNNVSDTPTLDQDSEQDIPTGYLDEGASRGGGRLVSLYHKRTGNYIDIPDSGLIIGRKQDMVDYIIRGNVNVGRKHCKLYYGDRGYLMVHDYDSLNGTFVNNSRVYSSRDVTIHDKDILSLADEDFEVISR